SYCRPRATGPAVCLGRPCLGNGGEPEALDQALLPRAAPGRADAGQRRERFCACGAWRLSRCRTAVQVLLFPRANADKSRAVQYVRVVTVRPEAVDPI